MIYLNSALFLLGVLSAIGCSQPARLPSQSALERLRPTISIVPESKDKHIRELAVSILAGNTSKADMALKRINAIENDAPTKKPKPGEIVGIAMEARLSMESTGTGFHDSAQTLLERKDLGLVQRKRLEKEIAVSPLSRASRQMKNSRKRRVAGTANSVVGAVGRSLSSGSLLPLRIIQALIGISVKEHRRRDLTSEERDALAQWKRFVELRPDDPRALQLLERIESAQWSWYKTQRKRNFKLAEEALEKNRPSLALALAERTLRYAPEDKNASSLRDDAKEQVRQLRGKRSRSLLAIQSSNVDNLRDARPLIVSLLKNHNIKESAEKLKAKNANLLDEAIFSIGIKLSEEGNEDQMWELFRGLGNLSDHDSNMSRHARNALYLPAQNPFGAFQRSLQKERNDQVRWLFFGHLAGGARDRDLPKALEWIIEIPALPGVVSSLPSRIIQFPWVRPMRRSPAVFARKYLAKNPKGSQIKYLKKWLEEYEIKRGNYLAAYRFANDRDAETKQLNLLKGKAAKQAFEGATKQKDGIARRALLGQVSRRFPDTDAGRDAGIMLNDEMSTLTPQSIRISKSFLIENPQVAGPGGLDLKAILLDGNLRNSEMHPDGIEILSEKVIQISYLGRSGKIRDQPIVKKEELSTRRMARLIAMLDESSMKQALIDPDVPIEYDSKRDVFFEHLRLGITPSSPEQRDESNYVFQGADERYGMVRARKSILPVELVIQGSTRDLGFGAYPRFKVPKRDPDQILYR